jgi:hypothetical protein
VFPEDWAAYAEVRRALPNVRLASGERWFGVAIAANTVSEMYYGGPVPEDLMATFRPLPGVGLVVDGTIVPCDASGFGVELKLSDIERATV